MELERDQDMTPQKKPLSHQFYFELKAVEFLNSLVCLKAELPKEFNCHKSLALKEVVEMAGAKASLTSSLSPEAGQKTLMGSRLEVPSLDP